jgi:predicted nucleic acid-binding protein
MKQVVFLDTVGLLALWNRRDQWHAVATTAFSRLIESRSRLVTTPAILMECGNAAARYAFRSSVVALRRELDQSGDLLYPTLEEIELAWQSYDQARWGDAGIVDCVSFVVMQREQIEQAFTNDSHFRQAGFETLF